jgi:hypothetical protein
MGSVLRRLAAAAPRWLPAVLLLVVAINQLRLARTEALSPWSGGGFGMFSSTDAPGNRHLHVFVQNEGIRRDVVIPRHLDDLALRATSLPTKDRLHDFATELALIESQGPIVWDEIEIQVWAVDYASGSLVPVGRLLRRERFNIASD